MSKNNKINLFTVFAFIVALLLPILVIPTINNPFFNSKGLLLFILAIGTVLAYIINSFREKKWLLSSNPLVLPLILFGGSILLSALVTNQYPYDQLVGWGGFFLSFVVIVIFAPTLIKKDFSQKFMQLLNVAGLIIVLDSVLSLFGLGFSQLLNRLTVFEFADNLAFTLTGGVLLNVQLLSTLLISNLLTKSQRTGWVQKIIIACLIVGLGINLYAMLPGQETSPVLLPLSASIAIARESLAVSRNALFGFGPNNYGQAFYGLRPAWLNSTDVWQFGFESATAFPLTLVVTGGMLALLSWFFLASRAVRLVTVKKEQKAQVLKYFIIAAIVWQIISPINTMMLALLALALSFYLAANLDSYKIKKFSFNNIFDPFNLQPQNKANRYSFTAISLLLMVGLIFLTYQVGRHYVAHAAAYQANAAATREDFDQVFVKQEQSRNLANRSALWRRIYSSSALELAVAISNKTDITPVEQEQVFELVNLAITEAKAATILEPRSHQNWLALANIYLQLLEVTEDAGQLAFESLAQAALTNPNDPFVRMDLGQLFTQFGQWEQASNFYIQAIERKPDLAVAYYNLAQVYVQNQQILEAENALQQTLLLIDKEENLEDYTVVETELAAITEQADQLRAQAAAQQAQGGVTTPEQPADFEDANLVNEEVVPDPATNEDSGLSELLNEQETSDLLREGSLIPEEETID